MRAGARQSAEQGVGVRNAAYATNEPGKAGSARRQRGAGGRAGAVSGAEGDTGKKRGRDRGRAGKRGHSNGTRRAGEGTSGRASGRMQRGGRNLTRNEGREWDWQWEWDWLLHAIGAAADCGVVSSHATVRRSARDSCLRVYAVDATANQPQILPL